MKKLLIFALGMILFISCAEPLENYKGYIVAKKYFIDENRVLLKHSSQLNEYQIGDTIK